MSSNYHVLSKKSWEQGEYAIMPIRYEDRYSIMKWRNEQMYHLRQSEPLTSEQQDRYFTQVVLPSFDHEQPSQILFSYLKNGECIGYGGLVHISWLDKRAEVSFIMNTQHEEEEFSDHWLMFLTLLEKVAFHELRLHKIFTYAFDLRPHLYPVLEKAGFRKEAELPEHCQFDGRFYSVLIHGKMNRSVRLRLAQKEDVDITYQWASNDEVRKFALTKNQIAEADHKAWFSQKLSSPDCLYFIAEYNQVAVGSFRLDIDKEGTAVISYLLDPLHHGKGLGKSLLLEGVKKAQADERIKTAVGYVLEANKASVHLFRKLDFHELTEKESLLKFQLELNENR